MENVKSEKTKNVITEGVIWKQLLLFFFPILFGAFFQQLYNTVDAVIIGRFVGTNELAAVGGSTGTIINLLVGFFTGLASGATVITARYYGAGDRENVKRAVHTGIAMAILGGLFLTVFGFFCTRYMLIWMQTPEEVISFSTLYLKIYFLGMIPNIYYNVTAAILRAVGDSRRPLYILIFTCVLNVILDLLFVVVLRLSVTGVAIATVLSQLVSAVLTTVILLKTKDCYRLEFREIRFHKGFLGKIVHIGLPAGMQGVAYSLANIVIQSNINMLGATTMAAYTAYSKIDCIFWMLINAFGVSVSTFAGQNYGAGRIDRVKKSMWITLAMASGAAISLSVILHFTGQYVYLLFTEDKEVLKIGMDILLFLTPFYITFVTIEVFSGTLRAMGFVFVPMLMTLLGVCAFRLVWIFTVVPGTRTIRSILVSYPLSWMITSVLFIVYYFILVARGKIPKSDRMKR